MPTLNSYEEFMAFLESHPDAVIESVRPVIVDPVTGKERDASFPWMDDFDEYDDDFESSLDEAMDFLSTGDFKQAAACLKEAAEAGNSDAQFNLGLCYAKGCGVKRDFTKAAEWMQKADENGDGDAGPLVVRFKKAKSLLKKAEDGDAAAQGELADFYLDLAGALTPFGGKNDYKAAYQWAKQSADQKDPDGLYQLGRCYQNGWGVRKSLASAVRCFTSGAELDHAGCQRDLGVWYLEGTHVKQDDKKGFQLNLKAAVQGDNQAMFNVGMCYQLGRGVGYSLKRALDWYEASQAAFPKPELADRIRLLKSMPDIEKEESPTGLPTGHKKDLATARAKIGKKGSGNRKTKTKSEQQKAKTTSERQKAKTPPETMEKSVPMLPGDNATADEYFAAAERLKRNAWEMLAQAEEYKEKGEAIRKKQYEEAVRLMEGAEKPEEYQQAAKAFEAIPGYLDADFKGKECRTKGKEIQRQIEERSNQRKYNKAVCLMKAAESFLDYRLAAEAFETVPGYLDSDAFQQECRNMEEENLEVQYSKATSMMETAETSEDFCNAAGEFFAVSGFRDADALQRKCQKKADEIKRKQELLQQRYETAVSLMQNATTSGEFQKAAEAFDAISSFLDADSLKLECEGKEKEAIQQEEEKKRRQEEKRKRSQYETAVSLMQSAVSSEQYHRAANLLRLVSGYLDADTLRMECEQEAILQEEKQQRLKEKKNELSEKVKELNAEIDKSEREIKVEKTRKETELASLRDKLNGLEILKNETECQIENAWTAEETASQLWQQLSKLNTKKNALGLFARSEKRDITDRIWSLEAELRKSEKTAAARSDYENELREVIQMIQELGEEYKNVETTFENDSRQREEKYQDLIREREATNAKLEEVKAELARIDPDLLTPSESTQD